MNDFDLRGIKDKARQEQRHPPQYGRNTPRATYKRRFSLGSTSSRANTMLGEEKDERGFMRE